MQIYGIDLAMEKFDVSFLDGKGSEKHLIVNNKLGAITRFLKRVPTGSLLCAEHTLNSPIKLVSVQLVLNFCLNAALNKIAFKTHRIFQVKVCNLYQQYLNVPEHADKRNFIPHLRAPK